MLLLMLALGVLFSLAMFRGLEHISGYHGSVYQALHPESFPGDAFMSPTRPSMLSLYYLLVKVVGEVWLDDRFTTVVFIVFAVLALAGVDKTAQLLGARRPAERVAMVSLMILGHQVLSNQGRLIGNAEFNPTLFASPLVIWLLYHTLAGPRPRIAIPLMAVILGFSIKNGWLPCLVTTVTLCKERLKPRGRMIAAATAMSLGVAGWVVYAMWLRAPYDVAHFNWIVHEFDNAEANPFLDPWYANLLFVALCLAGMGVKSLPAEVGSRVRLVAGVGLAVWLLGGLYLTYAPDAIKIPYVAPFDVTRALWWIQYVVYLALGVSLLKWLHRAQSLAGAGLAWGLLMALYFLHWTFHAKLAAVVAAVTLGMAALTWWTQRRVTPAARVQIAAAAMCLGALSLFGVGMVHRRWEALKFLARHGIVGDNGGAIWVDVTPYIREHTPASATVLALASRNAVGEDLGLGYHGSLRNRTGRSMPLGSPASFYADYPKIVWAKEQSEHMRQLVEAWKRQDAATVSAHLVALGSPDYLVAPIEHSEWLRERPGFAYQFETVRGDFGIFHRTSVKTARKG